MDQQMSILFELHISKCSNIWKARGLNIVWSFYIHPFLVRLNSLAYGLTGRMYIHVISTQISCPDYFFSILSIINFIHIMFVFCQL